MFGVPGFGDEYRAIGMPIGTTILVAYFPHNFESKDRLVNAPNWVWNDRFDFVGKVNADDVPKWKKFTEHGGWMQNPMLQTMLQNALANRCKLIIHRVPAEKNGYALIVSSHGPNRKNLVEARPDETVPDNAQRIALDGRMVPILSRDDPVLHFFQTSMTSFTLVMSGFGATVVDKTGLNGRYDFALTRLGTEGIPPVDWDLAPLGLKLIPAKIQTQNIVIDHIEKPTPN